MNQIQKDILYKLRYQSFLSYNKLWGKQGDSSKFAYHLKNVEQQDLVEKKKLGYRLTLKGIKMIDYLTLESPQPLSIVLVVAKRGNKVLVVERTKQPYQGYQEFCSSKVYQNETLESAAKDRLLRKLGLQGEVTYKGILFLQTKQEGELLMHHHMHVFLAEDPLGKEKVGEWVHLEPFGATKPLPHLQQTLRIIKNPGFSIAFGDLIKEGENYTNYISHSFRNFR